MRRFILLFVLLLTASTSLIAQDEAIPAWLAEGWTYERACLPEAPTEPPTDWTFDGTLLYWGQYGIHGYRQGWDSTRVMAFTNPTPGNFIVTSTLSPDLKQIAVVEGDDAWCFGSCSLNFIRINRMTVIQISDQNPRQRRSLYWHLNYTDDIRSNENEPRIIWLDDTTIAFPKWEINFEENQSRDHTHLLATDSMIIEALPYNIQSVRDSFNSVSPDLTRYFSLGSARTQFGIYFFYRLIDIASGHTISIFSEPLFDFAPYDLYADAALWSPDSARFMAFMRNSKTDPYWLTLVDQDGKTRLPIAQVDETNIYRLETNWSQQSNAVILKWIQYSSEELEIWGDHTYITGIAFPDEQHFVDLCLSDDSQTLYNLPILSDDGSQLAFIQRYQDSRPQFSIYDWRSGEWYLLAPDARGGLVGWAAW